MKYISEDGKKTIEIPDDCGDLIDRSVYLRNLIAALNLWKQKPETTRRNSMIESYWRQIKALQGMPAVKVTDNEPVQPVQS